MSLRAAIYNVCMASPPLVGAIGDRLFPDRLPDNVSLPAVVFNAYVSEIDDPYRTHDLGEVSRAQTRVQFDIYDATGDGAEVIADILTRIWSGLKDQAHGIGAAQVVNRVGTYETALNRHRVILDVVVDRAR